MYFTITGRELQVTETGIKQYTGDAAEIIGMELKNSTLPLQELRCSVNLIEGSWR
jgi:hypothetical protein